MRTNLKLTDLKMNDKIRGMSPYEVELAWEKLVSQSISGLLVPYETSITPLQMAVL